MKKLLLMIMIFYASFIFAQSYQFNEINANIELDTTLANIYNKKYYNYQDKNNIEYYDKRIKDVLVKFFWVKDNEYEEANANGWFITIFKPTLDKVLLERKQFLKNN